MRYLSVCSGIEAATVAWHPLGWTPHAFAEIEKFPSALLDYRYPTVPNLGDMTRFQEWPDASISLLVGGTPCQAFSVAGLRKGLADPRGNLTLTFLAIAARHRPTWVVWENVPGVLSDTTGAFGSLLGGLAELGYGWAYRVLDAQYFGVAQRRRRVFVVGYLGDYRRAGAVLFERQSLSGHPAPSRESRERSAPRLAARTRGGGGLGTDAELDGALVPETAGTFKSCAESGGWSNSADHAAAGYMIPEVCGTLSDGAHMGGGGSTVRTPIPGELSLCLNAGAMGRIDAESETLIPEQIGGGFDAFAIQERAISENPDAGPGGKGWQEGVGYTLEARHHVQAVAFANTAGDTNLGMSKPGVPPLTRRNGDPGNVFIPGMRVRRLTPRECERLQGFPDDYTLITYRGKPAADGPRYKALGNSMAVPVMRWIGERIAQVEALALERAA